MRIAHMMFGIVIAAYIVCMSHPALAKTAAELYQEGLMKENAEGDLEAAIKIYQKIVKKHSDQSDIAAKAQLHIGMCYEKQGREQAKEAYKNVIERFPNEAEIVQEAQARLQTLEEAEQVKRPAIGAGPEKTQAMIEELDRKRERVQSFRASTTATTEVVRKQSTMKASMLFKRPDRYRMEMAMPTGQTVNTFDGKTLWYYQPEMNMVTKADVERLRRDLPYYGSEDIVFNLFQGLDQESIRYIRATSLNGEKVYVFQGMSDTRMSQTGYAHLIPAWMEIWVGVEDGLMRRRIAYRDTGKEMSATEATIEEINPSIPDSTFIFEPPEGAQVMDMTDMVLSTWRQAESKKAEEKKGAEASKQETEAIMSEVEEECKAVKSYRAQVTRETQVMGAAMATHTTEWVKKDKRRMDMTNPMTPFFSSIGIVDKENGIGVTWTCMPQMKMVQKMDMKRLKSAMEEMEKETEKKEPSEEGSAEAKPPEIFHGMLKETVKYIGQESLAGEEVYVFEGTGGFADEQEEPILSQPRRIKVWASVNDGLVRKKVGYNESGEEIQSEIRTNVEVNINIPDSLFVYTPPDSFQVIDLTENAIKMARQKKGQSEESGGRK